MNEERLRELLEGLRSGERSVDQVLDRLRASPDEEDLGYAVLDHHRTLRRGHPEVVFGSGKTAEQVAHILERIHARGENAMATRVAPDKADRILQVLPDATFHETARVLTWRAQPVDARGRGPIAVVTAGTSDQAVAEEAAVVAEEFGNTVIRITDVGVAGLHRLVHRLDRLRAATVLIVVAGMEGALPSVVAGLVDRPVIAVPTSVGYGASFGGLAALLGMLNACAAGVTVVNIDNGFGAAYAATLINQD